MAFKNMNFEDTEAQEFDPEFAEFHAAAKRALKPKPATLSPSKHSSVLMALERLPFCGKNGPAQRCYHSVSEYVVLVPPMRLFFISLALSIACVCFMSSSISAHSEMAKLKAGIRNMELSLEEAADETLSEFDKTAITLSEKLAQQNARLASLVTENNQMRKELGEIHAHRKVCGDELIAMTGMLKQKLSSLIEAEEAHLLDEWSPYNATDAPAGEDDALPTEEIVDSGEEALPTEEVTETLTDGADAEDGEGARVMMADEGIDDTDAIPGETNAQADMLPEMNESEFAKGGLDDVERTADEELP